MTVYEIENRHTKLFIISMSSFLAVVVGVGILLGLLGVLPGNGNERRIISFESFASVVQSFWSVVLRFCSVGFLILWAGAFFFGLRSQLTDVPYEVCVYDNRTIEFKRIMSSVTMNGTEINVIEKRLVDTGEGVYRELGIQHTRGWINIGEFDRIEEFVDHLMKLNPAIIVKGSWA